MKRFNQNQEVSEEDVKFFLFKAHFYIIGSILVLGFATLVQAPMWVSIFFGLYGLYRVILLGIFSQTKKCAMKENITIEEYINKQR